MIINEFDGKVFGVVTTDAIPEGRMVLLTPNSQSYDFGSREDLPAVKLPTTADEASKAKFVLAFAQTNEKPPIYRSFPEVTNSLRYGFDKSPNTPFSAMIYVTPPSVQEGLTVPSGSLAVAFADGVFTVPSGAFVYSANLVAGALLSVGYSGNDQGKLQYDAAGTIAQVIEYDASANTLTFRLL